MEHIELSKAPAPPEPKVEGAWNVLVSAGAEVIEDTWYNAAQKAHVPRIGLRVGRLYQGFIPSEELSVQKARDTTAWLLVQQMVRGGI